MFRLLGFIIGSLASIAALVLMVGMPDFHLEGDAVDEDRYETAIEKLREKQQVVQDAFDELPVEAMLEDAVPIAEEMIATVAEPATVEQHDAQTSAAQVASNTEPDSQSDPVAELPGFKPLELSEPEWHAFWTPFRSEIAAKGFVRRLESVTGLDYRIVKVKNGVYQVTFSYLDDTERNTKLAQISAATGLDLSENLR